MKKSGKIVSQKCISSRVCEDENLLRQYDTSQRFFDISYERINQLKYKYTKPTKFGTIVKTQGFSQEPSRVSDWSDVGLCKSDVRQTINKIKQKYLQQSAIIETPNNHIDQFTSKVKVIDIDIDNKISNLESLLKQIKENNEVSNKENSVVKKLRTTKKDISPLLPKSPMRQLSSNVSQFPTEELKQSHQKSSEYLNFIYAIRDQVDLDQMFTQELLKVPKVQLARVKNLISKCYGKVDMAYFEPSPMQIDPLTPSPTAQLINDDSLAEELYGLYKQTDQHYRQKLYKNYKKQTIELFIKEFDDPSITLGHLACYLNLRTGKEFRNRAFVKLLRRMGVQGQQIGEGPFYVNFDQSH